MKCLLAALALSVACSAASASPVDDYVAARDAYVKQFAQADIMENEHDRDAHEAARRDLETRLRTIVGPSRLKGFPAEGRITLESLAEGYEGFGLLDGLVYATSDQKTRIVVTTRELLDGWLAAHKAWWGDKNDMPPGLEPAIKSEAFYTQALSTDAYFYKFADIPVSRAAEALAFATPVGRAQDEGRQTPGEVVVSVLRGERAYVIVAPAAAKAATTAQCAQGWKKAEKQALRDPSDKSETLREDAYRTYLRCFAEQAPRQSYFSALTRQAQALVSALPSR